MLSLTLDIVLAPESFASQKKPGARARATQPPLRKVDGTATEYFFNVMACAIDAQIQGEEENPNEQFSTQGWTHSQSKTHDSR